MRPLAFLFALLVFVAAAHAAPPRVNGLVVIGGLELHFDANAWDVNGAGGGYELFCKARDCPRMSIAVTVSATSAATCSPEALRFAGDQVATTHERADKFSNAGLTFLVAEGDFGCRNLAGGPVRACTTFGGSTYLFDAPGQQCHTPIKTAERVDDILRGLRPR